jgi:hypothetical protein
MPAIEELTPEEPKPSVPIEAVPYRAEFVLNTEQQAAKDKVLIDHPEAKSEFFWNDTTDGFKVVCGGEVLGSHHFFGYEWVNALESLAKGVKCA